MTIKEIENLSGMTRANIRFYEKEGLIKPQRDSNGYRNYSVDDLNILKRIRLLRTLHLSLDDIKSLSKNEQELTELLIQHLSSLRKEHRDLEQSMTVCEQLCKDHVSYENFDAQHYLDLLNASPDEVPAELREDAVPKVTSPWVRYFARSLDLSLYVTLWDALLALGFHINIMEMGFAGIILNIIVPVCILLLVEPLMLSRFGTTPGKFVFGLRVTAETGARLTHREALHRTWTVIRRGSGFLIPIYELIREYKSYKACKRGETLDWEEETLLWLDEGRVPLGILATIIGIIFFNVTEDRLNEKIRREFFQNASHELKTPLTTIIGYEEMIENGLIDDEKEMARAREAVIKESKRMESVIEDMLALSSLEYNMSNEKKVDVDAKEMVKDIVYSFEYLLNEKEITCSLKLSSVSLKMVPKDFDRLVRNLISNAIKYNKEKGKIYVVKGVSGCGKTTLLNIMGRLDRDYKGNITDDDDVIGFVLQQSLLFSNWTVGENLAFICNDIKKVQATAR